MRETTIKSELQAIAAKTEKLTVASVVDWAASHKSSALYRALEWDDAIAGRKYREQQVRMLIAVTVVDLNGDRQMVSLSIDRDHGGYRAVDDILQAPDLSEILLRDARAELERVQHKYGRVQQLTAVWHEIDRALGKKPQKAAKRRPKGGRPDSPPKGRRGKARLVRARGPARAKGE